MPATNLVVVNRALVLLGEEKITSLSDTDYVSDTCNELYEPVIVSLLGKTPWRFARTRVALTEDTGNEPINKWARAFLLPTLNTDRVAAPHSFYASADVRAPIHKDYELVGARVETDATALWCRYTKRQDETLWPESFARFATYALAAELAVPITQQKGLAADFKVMAFGTPSEELRGGMFKEAMQEDLWSDPDKSLLDHDDPLLNTRWG